MNYKLKNRPSQGFTLLEATMAMVLLSIASAGILLPFASAAAAQAEAQRRVAAARLAADAMETLIADGALVWEDFYANYAGPAYADMSCQIQTQPDAVMPGLTLVTVAVSYKNAPMVTLKTLTGS